MNRFKIPGAILGLLTTCLMPALRADGYNKETQLTIDQPLQIERTLLAPGKYVLKLAEPDRDHSIVSIYTADGARLAAIVTGQIAYRSHADDKKVFSVSQPQGSHPSVLKSWFYPGDNFGVEFPEIRAN
jgi:hypothetical protein